MKTIYTFSQKKINWVIFLIFLIISFPIYSQIPNTISYQGVLKDASNNLINGKKDLLFNIYESETGGTSKWSETHTQVDINNSFFNVILGEINSLSSLPFNVQYWLKITVDGSEMTPRLKLTSVPYSLNAKSLYLPFVGLNNTNDDTFKLETIGTGGGLRIELNNNNNDQPAIRATTSGIGRVAWFTNTNANNTATLFDITQFGTGRAMVINNTYNTNNEALRINYGGSDRALFINSLGTGHAFWASAKAPGLAGVFDGKVEISGDLDISGKISKGSGSFIIDHPLDPKNKVLSHSFVESPEMMNIYKGRGKLINGKVEIKLPK